MHQLQFLHLCRCHHLRHRLIVLVVLMMSVLESVQRMMMLFTRLACARVRDAVRMRQPQLQRLSRCRHPRHPPIVLVVHIMPVSVSVQRMMMSFTRLACAHARDAVPMLRPQLHLHQCRLRFHPLHLCPLTALVGRWMPASICVQLMMLLCSMRVYRPVKDDVRMFLRRVQVQSQCQYHLLFLRLCRLLCPLQVLGSVLGAGL